MRAPRQWTTVAAVTLLAVAACGGKSSSSPGSPGTAGSTGSGGASQTSFAKGQAVRIGMVVPLTGPFGFLGQFQRNSVQVEVDRINAAGGLGGAKVELVARDGGLDVQQTVSATRELATDSSVREVIGPDITALYDAAQRTLESNKKIGCEPAVAGGDFSKTKYSFRNQDPGQDDVTVMLRYLKAHGKKTVGLVYEHDDTGTFIDAQLRAQATQQGLTYLGPQFARTDDTSYVPYLSKLRNADAIWISSSATGPVKSVAAGQQVGYKGLFVGGSGIGAGNVPEAAGDRVTSIVFAATNTDFSTRTAPSTWPAGYQRHVGAVVQRYGTTTFPTSKYKVYDGTALAGDCVYLFAKAARIAGSLNPDAVAHAWETMTYSKDETPSSVAGTAGSSHEDFHPSDLQVYQYQKDNQGVYLKEVTATP